MNREYPENSEWVADVEDKPFVRKQKVGGTGKTRDTSDFQWERLSRRSGKSQGCVMFW